MSTKPWALHGWDLWQRVVGTRWRLVLGRRGSGIGHFLMAHRRRGYSGSAPHMHKVIALSNVLKLNAPAHPVVWTTAEHAAAAARLWPEDGTPTLALGPTDRKSTRLNSSH